MVSQTVTKAEGPKDGTVESGEQIPPASAPLSIEDLQSRIAEKDKEITTLQSQLKGRATENARLRKVQEDRQALKTELRTEIEEVVRSNFAALGETLFADEEPESPPSKKQQFLNKLKAQEKPPEKKQTPVDPELYAEAMTYKGRMDALEDITGVKVAQLPDEEMDELKEKWDKGDFKGAYEGVKTAIKAYQTKQAEKAEEAEKEKERKAKHAAVPKIPPGQVVTGRKPTLEELQASSPEQTSRKVQSGEWILSGWFS